MCARVDAMSRYLCELTLIDADTYLGYLPSQIAASALYLSFHTYQRAWTKQVAEIVGYSHDMLELRACVNDLYKTMQGATSHPQQAIQEKYKTAKHEFVAMVEAPKSLPLHMTVASNSTSSSTEESP